MIKIRALSLSVLLIVLAYALLDLSGLASEFNDTINQKNGWAKTATPNGVVYSKINTKIEAHITFLTDPEVNEFKIYRGTMKKEAVDRMTFLESKLIKTDGSSREDLDEMIKKIGQSVKANTAIIDAVYQSKKIEGGIEFPINKH
jgi:hypothetical protein